MANNALIEQAIDDLISQKKSDVMTTARKYGVVHSILLHRFKGQTFSAEETCSRRSQLLTNCP